MPAFVAAALLTASISTGVMYAANIIAASAVFSTFMGAFLTSTVLGGLSKTLPKRPSDE